MTRPGDLLLHPLALVAVVVLVVNDHLLKGMYGNWVTGKLSDVAGVFLLPLVLLGGLEVILWLARRPRWVSGARRVLAATLVTGVGFAAVKVFVPVGDAYGLAIGVLRGFRGPIEVIPDLTDLLVLPVLFGSWLVCRGRSAAAPHTPRAEQPPADAPKVASNA